MRLGLVHGQYKLRNNENEKGKIIQKLDFNNQICCRIRFLGKVKESRFCFRNIITEKSKAPFVRTQRNSYDCWNIHVLNSRCTCILLSVKVYYIVAMNWGKLLTKRVLCKFISLTLPIKVTDRVIAILLPSVRKVTEWNGNAKYGNEEGSKIAKMFVTLGITR